MVFECFFNFLPAKICCWIKVCSLRMNSESFSLNYTIPSIIHTHTSSSETYLNELPLVTNYWLTNQWIHILFQLKYCSCLPLSKPWSSKFMINHSYSVFLYIRNYILLFLCKIIRYDLREIWLLFLVY